MARIDSGTFGAQAMQAAVNPVKRENTASARPAAPVQIQQPDGNTDTATISSHTDFAELQNINDRQNQTASVIRSDDHQMQQSGQLLGQMKQTLITIVKNYPPYPPGEPERVKFLRSFNGLRQQIAQMTIPPEDKWYGKQVGTGSNSGSVYPAAGSPAPFQNIPTLPDLASNADVQAAQEQVDNASALLADRRAKLFDQAGAINQSEGYGAKADALVGSSGNTLGVTIPAGADAEQKSRDVKVELQKAPGYVLSDKQSPLMSLAG